MAQRSPRPKTPMKRLSENGGENSNNFPANFKRPKVCAVRDFPVNCGPLKLNAASNSPVRCAPLVCESSPSNFECANVDDVRNFPKNLGPFTSGIDGGKIQGSVNVEKPKNLDCELGSAPPVTVKRDKVKLIPSNGEEDDTGRKKGDDNKKKVGSSEGTWKNDADKLAEIIALAKEVLALFDSKYSTSKILKHVSSFEKPKPLIDTLLSQEKRLADKVVSKSVNGQTSDGNVSEERVKDGDRVSKIVEGKKFTVLEMKLENLEEDGYILPQKDVNLSQLCFRKSVGSKALNGETETKSEKRSSREFSGDGSNMLESRRMEIVDSVGEYSDCARFGQSNEVFASEQNGKNCKEKCQEPELMDFDECESLSETEQNESMEEFAMNDNFAIVEYTGEAGVNSNEDPIHCPNHKELTNLSIVKHDQPEAFKVREAIRMFEERYTKLQGRKAETREERKGNKHAHFEVAESLKAEGMWISAQKPFGHIPGIEIGDAFRFRAELVVVGLHCQFMSGIDFVVLERKKFATSIVNSGRYENEAKTRDSLIYLGQGGNPKIAEKAGDQKLEKGNLALMNSMKMGYPIRVIHKRKSEMASNILGLCNDASCAYVYDGLYTINKCWSERDNRYGYLVFKFELIRMLGQPRPHQAFSLSSKLLPCKEVCMIDDISQGKENLPICTINGIDDERPPHFTYTTKTIYPNWYECRENIGCNCVNGCSDSEQCPCVVKNEGEIPFNKKGAIIKAKPIIYECGPNCKCPPSCMNRVGQHGPQYQLEIFKTKSRGWGARSQDYITSGSFICEYIGELLQDKDAEQRISNDEYLFDIGDGHDEDGEFEGVLEPKLNDNGFAIDAAIFGNIGRFINHSCSPNLYAQEVLYERDDKRMPHVMFFATKNIPPLQELTYDYNYNIGRVCDVNGTVKIKHCYCGSRKCTGRMY